MPSSLDQAAVKRHCRTGHLISKLKGSLGRIATRSLLVMKINLTNNMRWKSIDHSDNSLGDYAYHVEGVSWTTVHFGHVPVVRVCCFERVGMFEVCKVPIKCLNNKTTESKSTWKCLLTVMLFPRRKGERGMPQSRYRNSMVHSLRSKSTRYYPSRVIFEK